MFGILQFHTNAKDGFGSYLLTLKTKQDMEYTIFAQ